MIGKKYLPKTLLGRSLLILGWPLVILQVITLWVFLDNHVDAVTRNQARAYAGEIALMVTLTRGTIRPDEPERTIESLETHLAVRIEMKAGARLDGVADRGLDTRPGFELHSALKVTVQRPFRVDTETVPRNVRVLVQMEDGTMEVTASLRKLTSATAEVFIAWSIGSAIVLLGIAVLFMRNQVKPIERLARAADDFGKGRDVPGFRPAGAAEVRKAATAFLIMKQRIARQMQQRTEMLAGVSHDLRTPLTRMKLQLALLGDNPEAKEMREDVAEMEHMVEAYLAFARGEGSEQAVEMDLGELVRDVAAQAQRQGGKISVEVRGAPRLQVRPNGMRRCLTNLVGNAVRYAKTVKISAARKSGFVEIAVDDDGPGIPAPQREEAFRPFHRLDEGHTRGTGGAGLGLTIARDVARGHGGDVVLADSPMGGLRALVRLPV